jgi:transglutaminase-like putative cysteine protease
VEPPLSVQHDDVEHLDGLVDGRKCQQHPAGVCRDVTHLAISFCRALNIPARYVFGYLPDMDVPIDLAPMDFAAWMEVWLDDRWWTAARAGARRSVDLDGADRVTYLLEQSFRYDYPGPVHQLRHRLVVLPPARHGTQHLRAHRVDMHGAVARRVTRRDTRGNTVLHLRAERVECSVQFRVATLLERVRGDGPVRLPADALTDPRLRQLAGELGRGETSPLELADRSCQTVHSAITYQYGVTTILTTAADALAGGRGVCQDSAHIMIALCHLLALPARYVSGRLLRQGGTHAWVEG